MYIGAAIDIGSNNEYQISENRKIYTFTYNQACSFKCPEGLYSYMLVCLPHRLLKTIQVSPTAFQFLL